MLKKEWLSQKSFQSTPDSPAFPNAKCWRARLRPRPYFSLLILFGSSHGLFTLRFIPPAQTSPLSSESVELTPRTTAPPGCVEGVHPPPSRLSLPSVLRRSEWHFHSPRCSGWKPSPMSRESRDSSVSHTPRPNTANLTPEYMLTLVTSRLLHCHHLSQRPSSLSVLDADSESVAMW